MIRLITPRSENELTVTVTVTSSFRLHVLTVSVTTVPYSPVRPSVGVCVASPQTDACAASSVPVESISTIEKVEPRGSACQRRQHRPRKPTNATCLNFFPLHTTHTHPSKGTHRAKTNNHGVFWVFWRCCAIGFALCSERLCSGSVWLGSQGTWLTFGPHIHRTTV
jgi:hypothetical protein